MRRHPLGLRQRPRTTQLQRIDNIFRQVVMSLPDPHAPLIVVGTPQSYEDTLFQLKDDPTFQWMREPAVFDDTTQATLWPERFDYRGLMRQRAAIKDRAFQVEYLLVPAALADAYFAPERVRESVDEDATMYSLDTPFSNPHHFPVYMGVDVGKSLHPSHLSVFIQGPDRTLVMLYHEFMDHLNYGAQTKHINRVIKHFDVTKGYYDNTRAELEDRGLSKRLRGVHFTKSKKSNMALLFEARVEATGDDPGIVLLPDGRMLRQISAVTKDLKSVETSEGHGDVFWSIALAVWAAADGPAAVDLGNVQEMFGNGRPRPARTD